MKFSQLFKLLILIFSLGIQGCSSDDSITDTVKNEEMKPSPISKPVDTKTPIIWNGSKIIFTKEIGADPMLEENQDRITETIWLTRANSGGELYNAKIETDAATNKSPFGTEWAKGSIASSDLSTLDFQSLRRTVRPFEIIDQDLILHLIDEDIYIDIKFLSWSRGGKQGNSGGFSYERSTLSETP